MKDRLVGIKRGNDQQVSQGNIAGTEPSYRFVRLPHPYISEAG
jgi:hypothetical protein